MLSLSHTLEAQLRAAMQRAFPEADAGLDPQLAPASKPEFGDFQANGALPLAKPLKQAPRQIATAIVEQLQADPAFTDLCLEPQIAGPGGGPSKRGGAFCTSIPRKGTNSKWQDNICFNEKAASARPPQAAAPLAAPSP